MVIVKASEESEAGTPAEPGTARGDGQLQRRTGQGGGDAGWRWLDASSKGKRVRFEGKKRSVIDGPFAETKELIAGYWLWQVRSMDEAPRRRGSCGTRRSIRGWGMELIEAGGDGIHLRGGSVGGSCRAA